MKRFFIFLILIQSQLLGQNKYLDVGLNLKREEIVNKVYADQGTQVFYNLPDKLEFEWNKCKFIFAFENSIITSIKMEKVFDDKKNLNLVLESILNFYSIQTEQVVDLQKQNHEKEFLYHYLVVREGKTNNIQVSESFSKNSFLMEVTCFPN